MHALEGLQIYYNSSNKSNIYHDVVGIILNNLEKMESATIYEVAEICYVSPTTISRLSRKLGYRSFQEFKSNLVDSVKNYEVLNRYISFNDKAKYKDGITAYLELLSTQIELLKSELNVAELDRRASWIHSCRNIHFYTNGIIFSEYRFQGDLIMAGHATEIKTSPLEQMEDIKKLGPEDLIIMTLPVVQDAVSVNDILKRIKEKNVQLFILTDAHYPLFQKYADDIYCFEGALGIIDDYRFSMYLNLLSIRFRELYL
ncbi:MurR/RpiR family transcriptional regulator [Anaerobium acetethylicum]|uniref:DNA-binding transcriptional regulator, MurR/RpiR family, contains HTH and SIS domains n=1 Tax=Anaerobium acetethylicum TaxID=1619234 RepID=A0A1D3TWD2_9FIRM|nr:MurR/RpiR family transcriptional regulator [Anaerobium acetethylicum]SCP98527.1 DNA-binding transcriptional regulator, MurR/RpiR family, contains HTH and SIS domains [Anaerobium acetethylicum]